ncbi:MAG: hypothetical protein WDZ37_01770 [Solirubrobacterales bacterium]
MRDVPSYGHTLAATLLAGILAWAIMLIPGVAFNDKVIGVHRDAILGKPDIDSGDRVLMYLVWLALIFVGYYVYAWCVQKLLPALQPSFQIERWDAFLALVVTGMLAAFIGWVFPFLGIVVAIFVAPIMVNIWVTRSGAPATA